MDSSPLAYASDYVMTQLMHISIYLLCLAVTVSEVQAGGLSDADRESLLGQLEKIRESADSKVDARFRLAIVAYRNATASDEAAFEFYLNCTEKVNFEQQRKKPAEFRDWKHKEADKLSAPSLRLALRHQLRWLLLTIEAASERADRPKLAAEAQEAVDAIFRDVDSLKGQEAVLGKPVTSTVFASVYGIDSIKGDQWALSPIHLDQVYETIIFPPLRTSSRVGELRTAWIKRIQQEAAKAEKWMPEARPTKKIGMASALQAPEYEKFLTENQPKLQWDMEVDLFHHGDEVSASVRMLAHLEKYINHDSARQWGDEFKELLKPAAKTTANTAN